MFCIKCGKNLPDDSEFCSRCGEKIAIASERKNTPSKTSFNEQRSVEKPIKGIVLNIISFVFTITSIIICLLSSYMYIKVNIFSFAYTSDRIEVSLFSIHEFYETLKYILGYSASKYIVLFQCIFVVCLADIVFAVIMLIRRLLRINGNKYNSSLSYIPIIAPVLSLACVFIININKTCEMFTAQYPATMILLLIMFVLNIIICEIGLNFNWEMNTRDNLQKNKPADNDKLFENTWDCTRCGWKNNIGDKYCRNCGKKP